MYAVFQTGGKQYRVKEGDIIEVEKLMPSKSKEVALKEILLCSDGKDVAVGQPFVKGAKIIAEFLGDFRAKKIVTYKYKRRKSYHKTIGHRQDLVRLRIKEISLKKE